MVSFYQNGHGNIRVSGGSGTRYGPVYSHTFKPHFSDGEVLSFLGSGNGYCARAQLSHQFYFHFLSYFFLEIRLRLYYLVSKFQNHQ